MVKHRTIKIETHKLFTNITEKVAEAAKEWGGTGLMNVFVQHSTACLKVMEDEILHQVDVRLALDEMFPKDKPRNGRYCHDLISLREGVDEGERINGFSHMRSLLFNTSETIPVIEGKLQLGKWQSIMFVELDSTPTRLRDVLLTGMLDV